MKNNKKRRFLAKKLWLGLFFLMMSFVNFGQVLEVDAAACSSLDEGGCYEAGNGQRCEWSEAKTKCEKKDNVSCEARTRAGCALDSSCFWDRNLTIDLKCISRGENNENKYKWKASDCGNENYFNAESKKFEYKVQKEGIEITTITSSANNACLDLIKDDAIGYVCDYPQYLSNEGKKKCRKYNDWKAKIEAESCLNAVNVQWEDSLKDRDAREEREKELGICNYSSYLDGPYTGPVFDGPGLSGGSQMAQMELSNSISKQRDLKKLLIDWAKFAIEIAFVLAVIAIIWAGFRYITDLGDGAGVEAAKKIILWTVVGIFVILGAYAIVSTVISTRFSDITMNTTIKHLKI